MKFQIIISVIFFLLIGVALNIFVLKLTTMPFIGLMLLALLVLGVVGNFFIKYKKKKGVDDESFIFPEKMAKGMRKMSLNVQYETTVLSTALLMLGILLFLIYYTFFTQSSWLMKGLIIFNSLCGFAMMGSMLITAYQQLVSYRESVKFLGDFAATPENIVQEEQTLYDEESYEPDQEYNNYTMKGGNKQYG